MNKPFNKISGMIFHKTNYEWIDTKFTRFFLDKILKHKFVFILFLIFLVVFNLY